MGPVRLGSLVICSRRQLHMLQRAYSIRRVYAIAQEPLLPTTVSAAISAYLGFAPDTPVRETHSSSRWADMDRALRAALTDIAGRMR